jgi:hypothetical protein
MSHEAAPVCVQHDGDVRMSLRTLHSDVASPGQLLGLFECPQCGHERRVPMESAA